jgi:hypothetical protein
MHNIHIIIISAVIFLMINIIENIIHYNIGKYHDMETSLSFPSKIDLLKIIFVMLVFALIQGVLTDIFL